MKKNLMIILLLLSFTCTARAQETTVESNQQVTSYLNSKNMSVDHSTGIFYYNVPLHEISAGNFSLPISLDYAARGVKTDDTPGVVGYNWNLNTGGIVTRVVRGGIADEIKLPDRLGAAYNWDHFLDTIDKGYLANHRQWDGELDIFTAVFNGRSLEFVIRVIDDNSNIEIIPLEPTNVRIECIFSEPTSINGWKITDEEGNEYIFQNSEWNIITREGIVETNSLKEEYYLSSWYLSSILPVNKPMIKYEYYDVMNENNWNKDSVLNQKMFSRTTIKYNYGQQMIDHPYDFSKYKMQFLMELDMAYTNFKWENLDLLDKLEHNRLYNSLDDFYINWPTYNVEMDFIAKNCKTMGILYDLYHVNQAYLGIINLLDMIINQSKFQPLTPKIKQAMIHLNNAKKIVSDCRDEENKISQQDAYNYSGQMIKSPLLKRITYNNQVVEFKYNRKGSASYLLERVIVRDVNNDVMKSICLSRDDLSRSVPNEISFHDKNGAKVSNIKLDYYDFTSTNVVTNMYGYYLGYYGNTNDNDYTRKHRFYNGYDQNTLYNSLKTIRLAEEAEVTVYYGNNTCALSLNDNGNGGGGQSNRFAGGIRIMGIDVLDKSTGRKDEITYMYRAGTYVLPKVGNKLIINYVAGFKDELFYDRLYNTGPDAYVKTGNNGIYYSEVRESFRGRGSVDYYFVVPDMSTPVYNYWNIGNPLGTCFYNSNGRLQKVIRYEYDEELALANKKYLNLTKACDYFVDEEKLTEKHGDNPYFVKNMKDRLKPILPDKQNYRMAYDYGVYLKRISEYHFEAEKLTSTRDNYLLESPCFTKTEFEYDLSRSTFPVKKTITNSDGTVFKEVVKRALDFDDRADASISMLKSKNMVGVPLKLQSKVVDRDGTERLLLEQVNKYEVFSLDRNIQVLQTETHEYMHDGTSVERVDSLFGFDRTRYDKMVIVYENNLEFWYPIAEEYSGDREEIRYDVLAGNIILRASLVPENSVIAGDYRWIKNWKFWMPRFRLNNLAAMKYKLCVISAKTTAVNVVLAVVKSGITTTHNFVTRANFQGPQIFDLDFTSNGEIDEVKLSSMWHDLAYIALVPADCEFVATSYNADGTIFCKFDHNGQAERYEYDAAGRVVKVFDQDGNLLKEKKYNVVLQ